MISQQQTRTDLYGSESAPSVLAIWIKERLEAFEGKSQEPGSERFATIGPSLELAAVPYLHFGSRSWAKLNRCQIGSPGRQ
jgi:hypothetical protein